MKIFQRTEIDFLLYCMQERLYEGGSSENILFNFVCYKVGLLCATAVFATIICENGYLRQQSFQQIVVAVTAVAHKLVTRIYAM